MEEFVTEEEEPWYDQRDLEQGEPSFLSLMVHEEGSYDVTMLKLLSVTECLAWIFGINRWMQDGGGGGGGMGREWKEKVASIVKRFMLGCTYCDNTVHLSTVAASPSSLISSSANYLDLVSGVSQNSLAD